MEEYFLCLFFFLSSHSPYWNLLVGRLNKLDSLIVVNGKHRVTVGDCNKVNPFI